ncbi:MAG: amidohydrolase family protein, partial [Longimicrobiales bacterium]|nr:amidohydrolase family protein [Longimicrobiales bacterium]
MITNARIWSGVPWAPVVDGGIAVLDDRIAAVGPWAEIEAWVGPETRVIDAEGGLVTPGFIDGHVHFLEGGYRLSSVQLRDAATPEEFIGRIAAFAETVPSGTWITGGDWDHENWGGELPRADWIDSVTAEHPVFVNRLDGHMALANRRAMDLAQVDASTPDVPGGEIVRSGGDRPAGVLKDNAMDLIARAIPDPGPARDDRALEAAMAHVGAHGVTSVHHMGAWADLAVFERARAEGRMTTRVTACTPLPRWTDLAERIREDGRGDEWLAVG